ncbi:acetolactate synthase I/II/III large subunit [Actinomadura sp. NBRC 104412]|uniref:thiamine pyrophosphate-binding protein n=1 Tax=Actinomadura sp. NBRC 104412 TaxID=3032203 RepID=UPI0024A56603|nr:thiamine pyrophosphate-binding protein [Actinomadura sp. NBRC 104412]GLZ02727.1 acetolactate synthase I/II/III large subunit [Actinomadura sp. NBRC 104412]
MTDASDAVARVVAAETGGPVFGVLGDGNLAFLDALTRRHGGRHVATAREDGGVLAADGYARVSGEVGVATATHGPGLTNTVTPLVEAARSRTPLVLVTADTDPAVPWHPQALDQARLAGAAEAAFVSVRSTATARADTAEAFARARSERHPVVLDVPVRLPAEAPSRDGVRGEEAAECGEAEIGAAVASALSARRVVVLAGRGAVRSGAREALVELADRLGALLATTLLATEYFAGEPYAVGISGGFADGLARDLLARADCVLVFGASFNPFTTDNGALYGKAQVVHCDTDAAAIGTHRPAEVALVGDARRVAERLLARLRADGVHREGWRSPELAGRLASRSPEDGFTDESDETGADPRSVALALDRVLPKERILVVDGGHAALSEPVRMIRVPEPSHLVYPLGFGSIGLGLAAAIGAAHARPGRVVAAVVGDGGLMMSLAEFDTAVRYGLAVIVIAMNDGAYGFEYHNMIRQGIPTGLAEFDRPDFASVARAMGGDGYSIGSVRELEELAPRLRRPERPVLVDVRLTRRVRTDWFTRFTRG